jgi:hypothetical protein
MQFGRSETCCAFSLLSVDPPPVVFPAAVRLECPSASVHKVEDRSSILITSHRSLRRGTRSGQSVNHEATPGTVLVRAGETSDKTGEVRRRHLDYSTAGSVNPEAIRRIKNTGASVYLNPKANFGENHGGGRKDVPVERVVQIADEVRYRDNIDKTAYWWPTDDPYSW